MRMLYFISHSRKHFLVWALVALLCAAPFARAQASDKPEKQTFTIGAMTNDIRVLGNLRTLTLYLTQQVSEIVPLMPRERLYGSVDELEQAFSEGEIDLIVETSLVALELQARGVAEPVMRARRGGIPDYTSILIARRDSDIQSLDDLKGTVIAFQDSGSTSGFLLPLATLSKHGLKTIAVSSASAHVPADTIGYILTDKDEDVAKLVVLGKVAAGAMSNIDMEDQNVLPASMRRHIRVLHTSDPIIRSLVLINTSMDTDLRTMILQNLATMHTTDAGWQAMMDFHRVRRFDLLDNTLRQQLDSLRDEFQLVRRYIK